jgi:Fe-S cluster assembly protein SufB
MYNKQQSKTYNYNKIWIQGINEENIKKISNFREEPEELLNFRLKSFNIWKNLKEPHWIDKYYHIDYDKLYPYSFMNNKSKKRIKNTFDAINLPKEEKDRINKFAIDVVVDSESVWTTEQKKLSDLGIIFCSMKEAAKKYPELLLKYLSSVVSIEDNFFSALNSAFFSDGTFCYIPKHTKCPIDLSSYFRIDSLFGSQFERTLIIADEYSELNYLEGCSAPVSKINQLHNAVVEIFACEGAIVNYSTLQNWYTGDENGVGGIYNFVIKRGLCFGNNSEINWLQIEIGSAITWKYPSCILKGDNSKGSFFSLNFTQNKMFSDTGTKMIHIGKNTSSFIHSKSCSKNNSTSVFRSKIKVSKNADNSKIFSNCDSMIIGKEATIKTIPEFEINNSNSNITHEARMFIIDENILIFLQLKGINKIDCEKLIIQNFSLDIIERLPDEFYLEIKPLLDFKIINNG